MGKEPRMYKSKPNVDCIFWNNYRKKTTGHNHYGTKAKVSKSNYFEITLPGGTCTMRCKCKRLHKHLFIFLSAARTTVVVKWWCEKWISWRRKYVRTYKTCRKLWPHSETWTREGSSTWTSRRETSAASRWQIRADAGRPFKWTSRKSCGSTERRDTTDSKTGSGKKVFER